MVAIKGGSALEKRLAELATKVTKPANLSVGFLQNSTYPDGTSVPMVAAIQEFGAAARKIPPRPFFRNMIAAKSPGWGDAIADLLKANDYDATRTMQQTGAGIKGQLQQSIVDTNAPALSPATVARKGSEKPLVDTGHMLNSVDFKVE
ncbi:hypothetical protein ACQKQD_18725 [Methylobacterium sp. NPDC080182]|uniref:hypothetical protein n=1 Tax=Methylobacterium sp. NPDC080182 TaxID=3390590 RepID=UPI003CFFAC62